MPNYGPAITAALNARGWSQYRLAREMGVAPCRITEWVSGRVRPRPETLFRIGEALGFSTTIRADGVQFVEPEAVQLPPEAD